MDKLLSALERDNVSVKNGNLEIALRKESVAGKDFTAGGIISRQTFVYGYYEARFKTPPAEGWHTAFWAMRHNDPAKKSKLPALLELDFCEQDGGDPHYYSVIASTLKGDRRVEESKLPNVVLCDYMRVYQHPKHRDAEAAVRAEVPRPLPPLGKKNTKPIGP